MSPRSRPPARRRRYCHHTAVLGTRRTRCGSHAACTSHTASASPVLAVASNSIPTYLQKGLRERVNKKSLLRRRCQFSYRGSHPGRHHGSRNLCRLTRPVPWQLRRASADGSCRTERPPRAPAGHPRAERRPRGAVPVAAACANVGSGSSGDRSARRAIRDRAQACARARSWPVRPVRRGRPHRPRGGCLAAHSALVRRGAWCTESLIHACPVRLPSGRDSRIGTGIRVGQRTGRSGGAH